MLPLNVSEVDLDETALAWRSFEEVGIVLYILFIGGNNMYEYVLSCHDDNNIMMIPTDGEERIMIRRLLPIILYS